MIYENVYLQAVSDFETVEPNEISFKAGDVLKALNRVDQNWLYGKVISEDNTRCGQFPLSYVSVLNIPEGLGQSNTSECLYLATNNFPKIENGDLDFLNGQLLIGKSQLDENWCSGCYLTNPSKTGIFPLTHVKKISFEEPIRSATAVNTDIIRKAVVVNSFSKASVDQTTSGDLNYLDMGIGDYVLVTKEIDSNWLFGENINGQKGLFPRYCVEFVENDTNEATSDSSTILNRTQRRRYMSIDKADGDVFVPSTKPIENVQQSYESPEYDYPTLTYDEEDRVTLTNENANSIGYCQVIYDFTPLSKSELGCLKNERLEIIEEVDEWYSARNDRGHVGLVPKSYVKPVDALAAASPSVEINSQIDANPILKNLENRQQLKKRVNSFNEQTQNQYSSHADKQTISENTQATFTKTTNSSSISSLIQNFDKPDSKREPIKKENSPKNSIKSRLSMPANEVVDKNIVKNEQKTKRFSLTPQKFLTTATTTTTNDNSDTNLTRTDSVSYKDLLKKFQEMPSIAVTTKPQSPGNLPKNNSNASLHTTNTTNQQEATATVAKKPIPPPIPPKPKFLTISKQNTNEETNPKQKEFIEDLKNQIENFKNLVKQQEVLNEKFSNENELILIDDDQRQLNEAKLNYFKNELAKLLEILTKMEPDSSVLEPVESEQNCSIIASTIVFNSIRSATSLENEKQMIEKKAHERDMCIDELLKTEREYYNQLNALYQAFFDERDIFSTPPEFDTALFGNLDEVLNITSHLLTLLEQEVAKNKSETRIGICFIHCANEIQQYYATYCRQHPNTYDLLKKFEKSPQIVEYMKNRLDQIRDILKNLDIQAILIKPAQRVARYHFFFERLIKNTPKTHCDYQDLVEARVIFKQVLFFINEYKRRKDLILKYTRDDNKNVLDKLTLNTFKKKYSRLETKFSIYLGLNCPTIDLQFSQEEESYRNVERNVKGLVKEIHEYTQSLKESFEFQLNITNVLLELYKEDLEQSNVFTILNGFFQAVLHQQYAHFVNETNHQILKPIMKLVKFFDLPNKLIEKRFNKLIDYDKSKAESEKFKTIDRKESVSDIDTRMLDYQALNAQLLDELPIFVNRSTLILNKCTKEFLKLLVNFIHAFTISLNELKNNPLIVKSVSFKSFDKSYLDNYNILNNGFNFVSNRKSFFFESLQPSVVTQNDSQRNELRMKYTLEKLYQVKRQCEENEGLCIIAANIGDIVAVIKHSDPTGRSDIWLVDNGDKKGLIPSDILVPIENEASNNTFIEQDLVQIDSTIDADQTASTVQHDVQKTMEIKETSNIQVESCVALYNFEPITSNMIQMKEGDVFVVLEKSDKKGDEQWWLIQKADTGQQGYVPSNYVLVLT